MGIHGLRTPVISLDLRCESIICVYGVFATRLPWCDKLVQVQSCRLGVLQNNA